jgi:hypothetical protein
MESTFSGSISEKKLILAHQVGQRDSDTCWAFLLKLKKAISGKRFQLTTDGLAAYRMNVPGRGPSSTIKFDHARGTKVRG